MTSSAAEATVAPTEASSSPNSVARRLASSAK
jgi:hypothetical protein